VPTRADPQSDREAPEPRDPRGSLVPRWLALLVLIALLAAAASAVHSLLSAEPLAAHHAGTQVRDPAPDAP